MCFTKNQSNMMIQAASTKKNVTSSVHPQAKWKAESKWSKLKVAFLLLRGEIASGNGNIDVIKKFKAALLKLREAKLINMWS